MIIFDTNEKLGYYQVGAQKYYSKPLALIEGTKQNIHPEWRFNHSILGNYNWQIEPTADLRELYRQRAQQLRDKYDYLKLEFEMSLEIHVVPSVLIISF